MVRGIAGALAAVVIAAAAIVGFGYLRGERATHLRPGGQAPDVELEAVEGPRGRLRDNLGAATLVVFLDTRWPDTAPYLEVLERLYRRYQRRGLRVIAIVLDESREAARDFFREHAITFTVFHDPDGRARQAGWGKPSGPESYLLDASGKVVETYPHPVNWLREDRRAPVEALLPSPAPGAW
jgi:peroxiredoxin